MDCQFYAFAKIFLLTFDQSKAQRYILHIRMSPEEVRDKLLFLRGGVIEDHQTKPGGLVLILGEAVGGVILCGSVKLLQPPLHLAQSAIGELVFLCTLEKDHLTAKHPLEWAATEGCRGDALRDVITVLIASGKPRSPLGILNNWRLGEVVLLEFSEVLGVLLNVDLELGGEELHLSEDAGQVAHLGGHSPFKVSEVSQELHEVVLIRLKEAGGDVRVS